MGAAGELGQVREGPGRRSRRSGCLQVRFAVESFPSPGRCGRRRVQCCRVGHEQQLSEGDAVLGKEELREPLGALRVSETLKSRIHLQDWPFSVESAVLAGLAKAGFASQPT